MPSIKTEAVRIEGYRQMRKQLNLLDEGFKPASKAANVEIATVVAEKAKARADGMGGVAAFVSPSIKPAKTANGASVYLGSGTLARRDGSAVKASLVAPGAEFGSAVFTQFSGWRGNGEDAGYFLMPTVRDMKPEIKEMAEDSIQDLINKIAN